MRINTTVVLAVFISFVSGWLSARIAICEPLRDEDALSINPNDAVMAESTGVLRNFGLSSSQLVIDPLTLQSLHGDQVGQTGMRSLPHALRLALHSVLFDASDAESPLANARYVLETIQHKKSHQIWLSPNRLRHVRYFLKKKMREQSTVLHLVNSSSSRFRPERGESIKSNWVFHLSIPSLSDHQYWLIVPKYILRKPYNYGFN